MIKKLLITLLVLLSFNKVVAQTPGMIIEPASGASKSVLDPNNDGYISTSTAGFLGNDKSNSEIAYRTLIAAGSEPSSDVRNGPNCGFSDFVESVSGGIDPVFHYSNGTNWLFRFRMASIAPNAKSYSILIDTDGLFGSTGPNADPTYTTSNPGFEVEIVLATKFGARIYNLENACGANLVKSYPVDRIQKSIAASTECSQMNFFLDFYVDWADLTPLGFTQATPMRYAIVDNMAADKSTICSPSSASDIGGVNDTACGSLENCFNVIINNQPLCSPSSPATCVFSDCPVITLPLSTGATTVSGTSTEASGTTIRVYKNTALIGSTTVTGGAWSLTGISPPLVIGDKISATAQATGEVESGTNCNNTTTVLGSTCTPPITSAYECGKSIQGIATPGAIVRVYKGTNTTPEIPGGGTIWTSGQSITATTLPSALSPNTQNFLHKCTTDGVSTRCNSSGAGCLTYGAYRITQQLAGQCESTPVWICVGGLSQTATPTISTTITTSTTSVSGTVPTPDNVVGVTVYLYANNIQIGTTTTTAGGNWTIPSLTFYTCDIVKALAVKTTVTVKCPSDYSTAQTISAGVTSAPTITGTYCTTATITKVTGTSSEPNGTEIQVFENGIAEGSTTTVLGGLWTATTGISIAPGRTITAKATNLTSCESQSVASAGVLVGSQTSNAVTITPASIVENTTSISGTGANGDTIKLYIDGHPVYQDLAETTLATAVVSGTSWTISTIYANALYSGGIVTATATSGSNCEGVKSDSTPVTCSPPSKTLTVNPDNTTVCSGSVVANVQVLLSQAGVIYQLFNNTLGLNSGSSVLGTGDPITPITLSSAVLTANATLSIKAIKFPFGSCTQTLDETVGVTVNAVPTLSLAVGSDAASICENTSTNITVALSQVGFNYQLRNGTTNIGSAVAGTGGTINLPTGNLSATTTFNVTATGVAPSSCTGQLTATKEITVIALPVVAAIADGSTAVCAGSDTAAFTNTTT
ncbi:hypothetical protein, partial [Flavobacterium laiguense]